MRKARIFSVSNGKAQIGALPVRKERDLYIGSFRVDGGNQLQGIVEDGYISTFFEGNDLWQEDVIFPVRGDKKPDTILIIDIDENLVFEEEGEGDFLLVYPDGVRTLVYELRDGAFTKRVKGKGE